MTGLTADVVAAADVVVLGASHGVGAALMLRLAQRGVAACGIARSTEKIALLQARAAACGLAPLRLFAEDLQHADTQRAVIADARCIVNCTDPLLFKALFDGRAGAPPRYVMLGSTRVFSRFPDERGQMVRDVSDKALASGWPVTVLHPSMIYGWRRGNLNVNELQRRLRLGVFPLPAGHGARVQPVHCDDVAAAIERCLDDASTIRREIVVAGGSVLTYAEFVHCCAEAAGLRPWLVPLPLWLLQWLVGLHNVVRPWRTIDPMVLRRFAEDRVFDVQEVEALGVRPRDFASGIGQITEV